MYLLISMVIQSMRLELIYSNYSLDVPNEYGNYIRTNNMAIDILPFPQYQALCGMCSTQYSSN